MSPKELFQRDEESAGRHRDMAHSSPVQAALMAAFNQFCWELPKPDNPQTSWAANAMREGAKQFIDTFTTLADSPKRRERPPTTQLEDPDANYTTRHARPSIPANA
jgi:hypothetical protein